MDSLDEHPSAVPQGATLLRRHAVAFFILGLLNNMMTACPYLTSGLGSVSYTHLTLPTICSV